MYKVEIQYWDEQQQEFITLRYIDQTEQMAKYLEEEARRMGLNCVVMKSGGNKC